MGFVLLGENTHKNLPVGRHLYLGELITWDEDDDISARGHASSNTLGKKAEFLSKREDTDGVLVCLDEISILHALVGVSFHNRHGEVLRTAQKVHAGSGIGVSVPNMVCCLTVAVLRGVTVLGRDCDGCHHPWRLRGLDHPQRLQCLDHPRKLRPFGQSWRLLYCGHYQRFWRDRSADYIRKMTQSSDFGITKIVKGRCRVWVQ